MSDGQRSGRSTGRVSCKSTELKRCSVTEMHLKSLSHLSLFCCWNLRSLIYICTIDQLKGHNCCSVQVNLMSTQDSIIIIMRHLMCLTSVIKMLNHGRKYSVQFVITRNIGDENEGVSCCHSLLHTTWASRNHQTSLQWCHLQESHQ